MPVVTDELLLKQVSDQGNQHNNGPHQDQIFDNPSAWHYGPNLGFGLGRTEANNRLGVGGGRRRTDAHNRLFMKP